jgi:hypothetical protein
MRPSNEPVVNLFYSKLKEDEIAYRGDSREPDKVFVSGLWNKQNADYKWFDLVSHLDFDSLEQYGAVDDAEERQRQGLLSLADSEAFADPSRVKVEAIQQNQKEYRISLIGAPNTFFTITLARPAVVRKELWKKYIQNRARFRLQPIRTKKQPNNTKPPYDIDPKTAVCLTLKPEVAPYFPIEGNLTPDGEWIWIYVTRLGGAIKTFTYQEALRQNHLADAQEVAVEHVPASHVLCAVHCWRKGVYPTMEFNLSPRIIWNPCASTYERERSRAQIEDKLSRFQGARAKCVASVLEGDPIRENLRVLQEPASPSGIIFNEFEVFTIPIDPIIRRKARSNEDELGISLVCPKKLDGVLVTYF